MFQDTHIHIQDIKAPDAIARFLEKTRAAGFKRFFNCAITPADWPTIKSLSEGNDAVVPFYGFHPWFADLADKNSFEKLEEFLSLPGAMAGELGLDKARKNIDFDLQKDVFTQQLILAKKFNKPFVVHSVRAWGQTIELIRTHAPGIKFMMHSFNGPKEIATELDGMGAYFSVSVRQFMKSDGDFQEVFKTLPADRLLLETDFPYQVKWTTSDEYLQAVRLGYEMAAAWRGVRVDELMEKVYANGTVFTH